MYKSRYLVLAWLVGRHQACRGEANEKGHPGRDWGDLNLSEPAA